MAQQRAQQQARQQQLQLHHAQEALRVHEQQQILLQKDNDFQHALNRNLEQRVAQLTDACAADDARVEVANATARQFESVNRSLLSEVANLKVQRWQAALLCAFLCFDHGFPLLFFLPSPLLPSRRRVQAFLRQHHAAEPVRISREHLREVRPHK